MYTRCPECTTCFRVTDRHLAIAKGKVRCGRCQHVFNAPDHAIDDLPTQQANTPQTKTPVTPPISSSPSKAPSSVPKAASSLITEKKADTTAKTKTTAELNTDRERVNVALDNKPKTATKRKAPLAKPLNKATAAATEKVLHKKASTELPEAAKPSSDKSKAESTHTEAPTFKADATMIADISLLESQELNEIDLDAPSTVQTAISDDEIFNDDFDLNAAIDELTQVNDDDDFPSLSIETTPTVPSENKNNKEMPPTSNNADVFTTDAYEATNATSVAQVLDEIGQLSLNIDEPTEDKPQEKKYNADEEFDFIELNDNENTAATNNQAIDIDEFNFDDDDFLDSFDIEDNNFENSKNNNSNLNTTAKPSATSSSAIADDELFAEFDLDSNHNNDFEESIVLETNSEMEKEKLDNDEIPFQLRNDIDKPPITTSRRLHPILSLFIIVLLITLSFSQLAFFRAHDLAKILPVAQPALEAFCENVSCIYSGPRNNKKIQLLSRDVRLHPKEKKALLISAAMVNNANFAQPYPNIHVRLSDISGNVVAERIFSAKTYMGKLNNPFLLMKSKTPVHINFEVVDPGKDAINFEFTFL